MSKRNPMPLGAICSTSKQIIEGLSKEEQSRLNDLFNSIVSAIQGELEYGEEEEGDDDGTRRSDVLGLIEEFTVAIEDIDQEWSM